MKAKIISALILAALLAVIFIQNTEVVIFRVFFWTISVSQVILVPLIAALGFFLGFALGALNRRKPGRP
jgi:uncharacterized integral membrane protein